MKNRDREICFFHSADLDGHASAAIIKMKYPQTKLVGINYGQPFQFQNISKNDTVFMVDFTLQPFEDMVNLIRKVGNDGLIWIDHHKTAIDDANTHMLHDTPFNMMCPGKREIGKAGCELTWEYLYPDEQMPKSISLLGRYDVWDLQDETVLQFQYGMRTNNTWPENQDMWKHHITPGKNSYPITEEVIEKGKIILKYEEQQNEKYCKSCAYEVQFEGFNAIVVNKLLTSSQLFKSIENKEKYDIMITFGLRGNGKWTMSFYTTKEEIDVSILAKKFGGGGHKQAAGCVVDTLPVELLKTSSV